MLAKLFKLLLLTFAIAHMVACGMYMVAKAGGTGVGGGASDDSKNLTGVRGFPPTVTPPSWYAATAARELVATQRAARFSPARAWRHESVAVAAEASVRAGSHDHPRGARRQARESLLELPINRSNTSDWRRKACLGTGWNSGASTISTAPTSSLNTSLVAFCL